MKSICIDLDATLAEYNGWKGVENIGQPLAGSVEFVNELAEKGYRIIIYTARLSPASNPRHGEQQIALKYITDWLDKHNFRWHDIYVGLGKPQAIAYVDDRAVSCRPQEDSNAYQHALTQIEKLSVKQKK